MKKIVFLILCCCFVLTALGQDVILTVKGETITSQIVRITSSRNVIFKLYPDDGNVYQFSLKKILYIQYADGRKVEYENGVEKKTMTVSPIVELPAIQNDSLIINSPIYENYNYRKMNAYKVDAQCFRTLGLIVGIASGIVCGISIGLVVGNYSSGGGILAGIGGGLIVGVVDYWLPFGIISTSYQKKAEIYSSNLMNVDFELLGMKMTTEFNLMHDNMVNTNALGFGLKINL